MVFWILFLLIWSLHDINYHRNILENIKNNAVAFVPYVFLVYLNLGLLMPKLLLRKRFGTYVTALFTAVVLTTVFCSFYLSYYFRFISEPTAIFFSSLSGIISIATEIIIALCLSMTLFLTDEWFVKDRVLKETQTKQLETELTLLKNQINPHFLFNSLNSIYILLSKNVSAGKKMLLQFSDILSYQLYETNKEYISLNSEFDNLNNYISIESARHSDLADISYSFATVDDHLVIAPMLLMPLVENAFKHGQSSNGYWIKISAKIQDKGILVFSVENSSPNQQKHEQVGIGLRNVRRRLELIYPKQHTIDISKGPTTFKVDLNIVLHES